MNNTNTINETSPWSVLDESIRESRRNIDRAHRVTDAIVQRTDAVDQNEVFKAAIRVGMLGDTMKINFEIIHATDQMKYFGATWATQGFLMPENRFAYLPLKPAEATAWELPVEVFIEICERVIEEITTIEIDIHEGRAT